MIWLNDPQNNNPVAINPQHIVAVFKITDESEFNGLTAVALINGQIMVKESDIEVVNLINGVK